MIKFAIFMMMNFDVFFKGLIDTFYEHDGQMHTRLGLHMHYQDLRIKEVTVTIPVFSTHVVQMIDS